MSPLEDLHGSLWLALLGPADAAPTVTRGITEARSRGAAGIIVSPPLLSATGPAEAAGLPVASVCGFPTGKHHTLIKAAEARLAVQFGAGEIGLVIDQAVARVDQNALLSEIVAVREAVPHPVVLAVMVEPALLEDTQLAAVCHTARTAGADRIIAGTGSADLGGVDPADIEVIAEALAGRGQAPQLGLSVLVRGADPANLRRLLAAGADRLLVDQFPE